MKLTISQARQILSRKSSAELKQVGYKTCSRCSGSGNYSYNTIYGSTCFKCNGLGYTKIKVKIKEELQ